MIEHSPNINDLSMNENYWLPFIKRGLHFLYININNHFVKNCWTPRNRQNIKSHSNWYNRIKSNKSVIDGKINITGYSIWLFEQTFCSYCKCIYFRRSKSKGGRNSYMAHWPHDWARNIGATLNILPPEYRLDIWLHSPNYRSRII